MSKYLPNGTKIMSEAILDPGSGISIYCFMTRMAIKSPSFLQPPGIHQWDTQSTEPTSVGKVHPPTQSQGDGDNGKRQQ